MNFTVVLLISCLFFREILLQNASFQINSREKTELFLFVSWSMHRPISNCILQLYGLIFMNFTVVLLISCFFFKKSCYKTPFFKLKLEEM